jgi:hypothetical protein
MDKLRKPSGRVRWDAGVLGVGNTRRWGGVAQTIAHAFLCVNASDSEAIPERVTKAWNFEIRLSK